MLQAHKLTVGRFLILITLIDISVLFLISSTMLTVAVISRALDKVVSVILRSRLHYSVLDLAVTNHLRIFEKSASFLYNIRNEKRKCTINNHLSSCTIDVWF